MFALRHLSKARFITKLSQGENLLRTTVRKAHHFNYRKGPPPPSGKNILISEIAQGFMWWWMLWHLWTEGEEIIGIFKYPDTSLWSDEDLGIPERLDLDKKKK